MRSQVQFLVGRQVGRKDENVQIRRGTREREEGKEGRGKKSEKGRETWNKASVNAEGRRAEGRV